MATKTETFKATLNKLEVYPKLSIEHPNNPNRLWAFPILGGVVKAIILLPIFLEIAVLSVFDFFIIIINSFFVITTDKYWPFCFEFNLGLMRLLAKVTFFFSGLTDKYPGFDFETKDFTLELEMPKNPSKLFAIPLLGILARIILLFPFLVYGSIINSASRIGIIVSSVPVLFSGKYPQATYELTQDSVRLGFAQTAYFLGIHDNYPSFKINTSHATFKIVLIAIALVFTLFQAAVSEEKPQNEVDSANPVIENSTSNQNGYH